MTKSIWSQIKEEFQLKKFGLEYDTPVDFVRAACCNLSVVWVILEALAALFFISLLMYSVAEASFNAIWLTYLSNWSLIISATCCVVHFICITIDIGMQRFFRPAGKTYMKMPFLFKVDWVLHNIRFSISLIVAILRWSFEFELQEKFFVDLALKFILISYSLFHMILWEIPINLLHVYQPMLVGIGYAIFSGVYWSQGGIYPNGLRYEVSFINFDANLTLAVGSLLIFITLILPACFGIQYITSHIIGWIRVLCSCNVPNHGDDADDDDAVEVNSSRHYYQNNYENGDGYENKAVVENYDNRFVQDNEYRRFDDHSGRRIAYSYDNRVDGLTDVPYERYDNLRAPASLPQQQQQQYQQHQLPFGDTRTAHNDNIQHGNFVSIINIPREEPNQPIAMSVLR